MGKSVQRKSLAKKKCKSQSDEEKRQSYGRVRYMAKRERAKPKEKVYIKLNVRNQQCPAGWRWKCTKTVVGVLWGADEFRKREMRLGLVKQEVLTTFQSQVNEEVVETFTLGLQNDPTPPNRWCPVRVSTVYGRDGGRWSTVLTPEQNSWKKNKSVGHTFQSVNSGVKFQVSCGLSFVV